MRDGEKETLSMQDFLILLSRTTKKVYVYGKFSGHNRNTWLAVDRELLAKDCILSQYGFVKFDPQGSCLFIEKFLKQIPAEQLVAEKEVSNEL
jgi:hypothetical protein